MEECVLIDGDILNQVIIPTTNVDRLLPDNSRQKDEVINKSQVYITTAGYKNSFAYAKLIQLLVQSVTDPDLCMIMGGTYVTPVKEGLLDEDFVDQLKMQGTFNDASFDRQYRSIWSGDAENAFFSSEKFDKLRVLLQPEKEYSKRSTKAAYYVMGVDVGRLDCTTEICIIKVTPHSKGVPIKSVVNLFSLDAKDFQQQAIKIKQLYYRYKIRTIAIDANGLGVGLIDFLTKGQVDPETGDDLPPFGVEDGTFEQAVKQYKHVKGPDVEMDALYLIKGNAPINTQAYAYTQAQMNNGKIKFLIDEAQAKTKLMASKIGQSMSTDQRNDYLRPFTMTSILKAQMLNLAESNEGTNIILKQVTRSIRKDKFSALIYGLLYIKRVEENQNRRRKRSISDFMFFS